eukprot:1763307-Rhodomonas_salina.1
MDPDPGPSSHSSLSTVESSSPHYDVTLDSFFHLALCSRKDRRQVLFATRTRQVDTELLHNTNRDCTLREHLALSLSRVWGEEGLTTVKPQDLSMSYSRVAPALAEGHTITGGQDTRRYGPTPFACRKSREGGGEKVAEEWWELLKLIDFDGWVRISLVNAICLGARYAMSGTERA